MRPVYFYGAMSLDGYLADANDDLQWLFDTDLAGASTYPAFEQKIDTLVMGHKTYEASKRLLGDAPFYPGMHKVIFSHSAHTPTPDTTWVQGDPVPVVQALQQQPGKAIWIVGGGQLVADLLEARMIDELWVQVAPVLLGAGKPLFPIGDYRQRFDLVDTTTMGALTELHLQKTGGTEGED